ncbi:hypothetical protein At1D1460_49170 (plasmid) [Agrobacterium tumefaciens]|nr:hypothetical protein At1D1460_49170 [Agrobacterium tumefaciens]
MGIVGVVAGEIANSPIGAIRTLLEAPIRLPFRLERQHADTQQPGVVFNADKLGGIGRCQPLVGEGKTELKIGPDGQNDMTTTITSAETGRSIIANKSATAS